MARDNQSITRETQRQWWHNDLSPRFTCLPISYVLVVAIHPLGGSRANKNHTPNPQSNVAQPTQDGDPQATSNPLDYLLALHRGKVKNPSQSPRSELETSTFLRLMKLISITIVTISGLSYYHHNHHVPSITMRKEALSSSHYPGETTIQIDFN